MSATSPLFRTWPLKDWTVLLGLGFGGLSAFDTLRYDYFVVNGVKATENFETAEVLAALIDSSIGVGIGFVLIGGIFALVRRRVTKSSAQEIHHSSPSKGTQIACAVLVVSALALGAAYLDASIGPNVGVNQLAQSETRCKQKGEDEICITASDLGNLRIRLDVLWTYALPKDIWGDNIAAIRWIAIIDCQSSTGTIENLYAINSIGNQVVIDVADLKAMMAGIQRDQVGAIAERCQ